MSEEQKKIIAEVVGNMKLMNEKSLLLMRNGSELLRSRDSMDKPETTSVMNEKKV